MIFILPLFFFPEAPADDDLEEDDEVEDEEDDYEEEKPAAKKAKGAAGKAAGGNKGGQAAKGILFIDFSKSVQVCIFYSVNFFQDEFCYVCMLSSV